MTSADRDALVVWLGSRVALLLGTLGVVWLVLDQGDGGVPGLISAWDHWDTGLFVKIARFGYDGYPAHYPDQGVVAFFPGLPLLLRAVHAIVPSWVGAGLAISAVAGAVACVSLARVAALDAPALASVPRRAVLYLLLSPYAVFLAAAYSEALFLALALPAWLAARRHRWVLAGALGAGAASVRVTGVFLAMALVVQWAVEPGPAGRRAADAAALALPFGAIAGYVLYLHGLTGDWLAWQHAQQQVWHRTFTAPWTALSTTWHAAFGARIDPAFVWSFRADIAAVGIGVALSGWLLVRRRWAELVYVGGQVAALATSQYYLSVARATLLWWPLWIGLAGAAASRRWVHPAYLAVAPALMVVAVVAFLQGHWVD